MNLSSTEPPRVSTGMEVEDPVSYEGPPSLRTRLWSTTTSQDRQKSCTLTRLLNPDVQKSWSSLGSLVALLPERSRLWWSPRRSFLSSGHENYTSRSLSPPTTKPTPPPSSSSGLWKSPEVEGRRHLGHRIPLL